LAAVVYYSYAVT